MKKLASIVAVLAIAPVLFASAPAFADSPGQLSNSPTNYKVRNVTQNGAYGQSTTAACGETVKYSVILANSDFGQLTNVTVKANLANGAINASAKNTANQTTSVSGSATVSAPGSLSYVAGSTVRIASDAVTKTPLANGITTSNGVDVGTLAGSTQIFVQFEAKVNCDKPPVKIEVCELDTKKIVTINESDFNSAKHSKDLSKCNAVVVTTATPTTLVKTGAGDVAALFAGVAVLAALAYRIVLRRQSAR